MIRKRRFAHLVACAVVLVLSGVLAGAASARPVPQTAPGDVLDPRTYAPDSKLFLVLHAEGTQNYTCSEAGAWVFTAPEATLFKTTGASKPVGKHFLNVLTGRPVWELDNGSSVEAARTQMQSGGAGNIAWLLLQAVATTPGHLGDVTWIQRLNTVGGVAPAGTCTPGATIKVPYSADYFFWR